MADAAVNWLRALPWLIVGGAIYFLLLAAVEERKLTIAVEGAQRSFEPAFVRLRIRVAPHPDNRALAVGLVGDSFETSSLEQLEGAQAPISRWREYKSVPAGEYWAVAELHRSDGSRTHARAPLTVIGRGY